MVLIKYVKNISYDIYCGKYTRFSLVWISRSLTTADFNAILAVVATLLPGPNLLRSLESVRKLALADWTEQKSDADCDQTKFFFVIFQ